MLYDVLKEMELHSSIKKIDKPLKRFYDKDSQYVLNKGMSIRLSMQKVEEQVEVVLHAMLERC